MHFLLHEVFREFLGPDKVHADVHDLGEGHLVHLPLLPDRTVLLPALLPLVDPLLLRRVTLVQNLLVNQDLLLLPAGLLHLLVGLLFQQVLLYLGVVLTQFLQHLLEELLVVAPTLTGTLVGQVLTHEGEYFGVAFIILLYHNVIITLYEILIELTLLGSPASDLIDRALGVDPLVDAVVLTLYERLVVGVEVGGPFALGGQLPLAHEFYLLFYLQFDALVSLGRQLGVHLFHLQTPVFQLREGGHLVK